MLNAFPPSKFVSYLRVCLVTIFLVTLAACGSSSGGGTNTGNQTGTGTPGSGGNGGTDTGGSPGTGGGTDNGGGTDPGGNPGGGNDGGLPVNAPIAIYGDMIRTDGTDAGTVSVFATGTARPYSFLYGGSELNGGGSLTELNGEFYFQANTAAAGFELWKTNGTPQGTVLVKDINPGTAHAFHYRFADFTAFNGAVYFQANDGTNGYELWKTDGTTEGTALVKDIYPGATGSGPSSYTAFNGALYFHANDGTGRKLWKTNGTAEGTEKVNDVLLASGSGTGVLPDSVSRSFPILNGNLYFDDINTNEVWQTDGTAAGTVRIGDSTTHPWANNLQSGFAVSNNSIYFQAEPDTTEWNWELFKSDGGPGMVMVKDINTENGGRRSDYAFSRFASFNGAVYFQSRDNVNQSRFWKTDGSAEGTVRVLDFTSVSLVKVMPDAFYFAGTAGGVNGLWKIDSGGQGPILVKDYNSL